MIAIISIGSNLGDRYKYLQLAVDQIAALPKTIITKISSIYETAPQLKLDQPNFYNAVLEIETDLTAEKLLSSLKEIEVLAERERSIPNGPRTLDTDIIICTELEIKSAELELPHPRAHERQFVLLPWLEIDPDAVLIPKGKIAEICAALGDQGVVKVLEHKLV